MKPVSVAEWQDALARMETALADTAALLTQNEEELPATQSDADEVQPRYLPAIEHRLTEWNTRLQAAEAAIARDEQLLMEQASALDRWRALFARWENLVQRKETASPDS